MIPWERLAPATDGGISSILFTEYTIVGFSAAAAPNPQAVWTPPRSVYSSSVAIARFGAFSKATSGLGRSSDYKRR